MLTPPTYYFKVYDNISTNGSVGEIYNMLMSSCIIQCSNNRAGKLSLTLYLMKASQFQENLGKPLPNISYTFSSDYIEKWLDMAIRTQIL